MIEVFSTNIQTLEDADQVISVLSQKIKSGRITIDLDDHERILRIEAPLIDCREVYFHIDDLGFQCNVLE